MNRGAIDINRIPPGPLFMNSRARKFGFWKWLLIPFVMGMVTVSHLEGLSKVMILYGLFVAGLYSVYSIYNRLTLQPEIVIYFIWITWSLSGAIFATDKGLFYTDIFTLIQIGALIFVVAGVVSLRVSISEVMFAILVGVLILLSLSLYHGEIQQAVDSRTRAASRSPC